MSRPDWTVTAPLQPGLTVLEASAGTGKTWQIAHLVVRLVTERDLRVGKLLVVTFTRAATAELRDRIRRRLTAAVRALIRPDTALGDVGLEALVAGAAAGDCAGLWLRRLRRAQEELDEATLSTIHGFCQRMLRQHAFDSGADLDLELIGDPAELRAEVVDDVMSQSLHAVDAARYALLTGPVGLTRKLLARVVRVATGDPDLPVLPDPSLPPPSADGVRLAVAEFIADFDPAGLVAAFGEALGSERIRPAGTASKVTKYTPARASKACAELVRWLSQDWSPDADAAVPGAGWFSAKELSVYTDPDDPWTHPELERVRGLLERVEGWPEMALAWERAKIVVDARRRLDARCAAAGQQTYGDLLRSLAHRLAEGSANRERLRAAIAERFDAVLIDEFQDTDTRQWTLFETVFGGGQHHLYLIGDPKQAIYAFRGANVHVYERAVRSAEQTPGGRVATMRRNFRSDDRLVAALNGLWGGGLDWFGSGAIRYEAVTARHVADRLVPPKGWADPTSAPLQVRFLDRSSLPNPGGRSDPLGKGEANPLLARTVAADVLAMLRGGLTLTREPDDPRGPALGPGDIAVLVRTGFQAGDVVQALRDLGLPAVRSGGSSIFSTEAAVVIQEFLEALESPRSDVAARRLAVAPPFGWTGDQLAAIHQEDPDTLGAWEGWLGGLGRWRGLADQRGVLLAWRRALDETDALDRLLARPGGERLVTDLQHLVELLHAVQSKERLQLPALIRWYEARRAGADDRAESEQLRLERDDDAVQVVTMHSAKGLQYPVVFLPWLWEGAREPQADWLIVPSGDDPTERVLDLRPGWAKPDALARARRETRTEDMRLAYVALTRACHRAVVYAGSLVGYPSSPLATLLHGPDVPGDQDLLDGVEALLAPLDESALWQGLQARMAGLVAADKTPLAAVSRVALELDAPERWPRKAAGLQPVPRDFLRRGLDPVWRRSSYTSLVKGRELHEISLDPETRAAFEADHDQAAELETETDRVLVPPPPVDAEGVDDVLLAGFPAGADAGTCLHAIFEHLDFQAEGPAVGQVVSEQLMRHGIDVARHQDAVVSGLAQVLQTPLGGDLGGLRLADLPRRRRLDELRFDLPIAGGDRHRRAENPDDCTARLDGRALARAFREVPWGPRPEYLAAVAGLDFGPLAGFLTGSIDLVFRDDQGRFWVADYKSNRLDPHRTRRCVPAQFAQVHLAHEMERHHYYLQGALYSLALHRWLRARLGDGYRPDAHLGGAAYLFVRGMVGADTPIDGDRRHGVCLFKPPVALLDRLGALFDDPATAGGAR